MSTTTAEVPVVWIEQTGPIAKGPVPWSTVPGFVAPIRYTLSDGTQRDSTEKSSKKKDLVAKLATFPAHPKNPMFAKFRDGQLVAYRTSFWIGAGDDGTGKTAEWQEACATFDQGQA